MHLSKGVHLMVPIQEQGNVELIYSNMQGHCTVWVEVMSGSKHSTFTECCVEKSQMGVRITRKVSNVHFPLRRNPFVYTVQSCSRCFHGRQDLVLLYF